MIRWWERKEKKYFVYIFMYLYKSNWSDNGSWYFYCKSGPCLGPSDGSSPIGLANTVRSASVSKALRLNSASFWLLYHRCQMCLMDCRLSLTNSACPPLSFPSTIYPQTLPQHLHLCNPLLVCNNLDFTTFMACVHSLIFTCWSILKQIRMASCHFISLYFIVHLLKVWKIYYMNT